MDKILSYKRNAQEMLRQKGLSAGDGYRNAFGSRRAPSGYGGYKFTDSPQPMHRNMMGNKNYGFAGGQADKMPYAIRHLTCVITNDDTQDLGLSLFGGFFEATGTGIGGEPFNGTPDFNGTVAGPGVGITVQFNDRTHKYIQDTQKSNPILIVGMRLRVASGKEAQYDNQLKGVDITPNSDSSLIINPNDYIHEMQQLPNIITIKDFEFLSDGNRALQFIVNADTVLNIRFDVRVAASPGEKVAGGTGTLVSNDSSVIDRPYLMG